MKSLIASLVLASLAIAGCAGSRQTEAPPAKVELLTMTPLPSLTSPQTLTGTRLNLLLHIGKDGSVADVRLLGSSGDAAWDSLALKSIRQWRFVPPKLDGVPTDIWLRQLVVVQVQEPIIMTLGELTAGNPRVADSLYALLKGGADLDTLFLRTVRRVDVALQPQQIREALRELADGDFTAPLRLGDNYIIYKRFCRVP